MTCTLERWSLYKIFSFIRYKQNIVHIHTHDRAAGYLELERARVRWFLSINYGVIPEHIKATGARTYRALMIENEEFEFTGGFTELHTRSYEDILSGGGFRIGTARKAIELIHDIRHKTPIGVSGEYHPFARYELAKHPFDR